MKTDQSFPRTSRLLQADAFKRVFQRAERLSDRYWTLLIRASEHTPPRLGLAISKKVAKRAVSRNRLKRIARETFRHAKPDLGSIDVVVMAKPHADSALTPELKRSLERHWRKLQKSNVAPITPPKN